MTTLTITIPDEVSARLADQARLTDRTVEDLAREYLAERAEDEEDARIAAKRVADPDTRYYSTDEVRKALGIEKKAVGDKA